MRRYVSNRHPTSLPESESSVLDLGFCTVGLASPLPPLSLPPALVFGFPPALFLGSFFVLPDLGFGSALDLLIGLGARPDLRGGSSACLGLASFESPLSS